MYTARTIYGVKGSSHFFSTHRKTLSPWVCCVIFTTGSLNTGKIVRTLNICKLGKVIRDFVTISQ